MKKCIRFEFLAHGIKTVQFSQNYVDELMNVYDSFGPSRHISAFGFLNSDPEYLCRKHVINACHYTVSKCVLETNTDM